MMRALILSALVVVVSACGMPVEDIDQDSLQTECGSDHPLVGSAGSFETHFHGVAGTVTAVDDCTIQIENFTYDGTGLDVRIIGSPDQDWNNGIALTNDLRQSGGYDKESLTLSLPEGVTLDDVQTLSVWCVTVSENFGDAAL